MFKKTIASSERIFCLFCDNDHYPVEESAYFQRLTLNIQNNISISDKGRNEIMNNALADLVTAMYEVFEKIIDIKSNFSNKHHLKVANYCLAMAQMMGLDTKYQNVAYYAGLLHDIGKIHIPDNILFKKGKLTEEERQKMNQHAEFSWQFLKNIGLIEAEATIARHHHTSVFEEESILVNITKILTIADAFDAMTNSRNYNKNTRSIASAKAEIEKCLGSHFDKNIYEKAFLPWFDAGFPLPDTSVLNIKKRFPVVFSSERTLSEKLKIFLDLERGIFKFFISVMQESDFNLRGCNPYKQAKYAYIIAQKCLNLSYNTCDTVYRGALFGYFGRMFLDDSFRFNGQNMNKVVVKEQIMEKNSEVFSVLPNFEDVAYVTKFIFEDWNGVASPFGHSGEDIPLESRIIRCAYAYHLFGIEGLLVMRGKELQPEMVDKFIEYLQNNDTVIPYVYLDNVD